jgi:PhnB protein
MYVANNPLYCRYTTAQSINTDSIFESSIKNKSMGQITAYLFFNGNTREAMSFYKDCMGGELVIQKIAESPMAVQLPASMSNKVLHSSLSKDGFVLMASDCMQGEILNGNNIQLCIDCSSEEELNNFYNNLSANGKINHPLQQTFWGATFGDITDKFGINWMFNYTKK